MKKLILLPFILMFCMYGHAQLVPLPVNPGGYDEDPKSFVNLGGVTYFVAYKNLIGYELFKTDGTPAGTVLVADINPGSGGGVYSPKLTVLNNTLYFFADDGVHGKELWKSDGTTAGTTLVKDINPGINGCTSTYGITATNTTLYFFAEDTLNGGRYGLWKSDGTAAGTSYLKRCTPTNYTTMIYNNKLYFDADLYNGHGDELIVSDGTVTGTVEVKEILTGATGSKPYGLTQCGSKFVFGATGANGQELYISDGTAGGTVLLSDINSYGNSSPAGFSMYNNTVLFYANDSTHGNEPWITDGTLSGTKLLLDIIPGPSGTSIPAIYYGVPKFGAFNTKMYFGCNSLFWETDGTSAGTKTFMQASTTPYYGTFSVLAGRMYFAVRKSSIQNIWSTSNGSDTVRHTFYNTPSFSFTTLFAGNNELLVHLYNSSVQISNLYKLDIGQCVPKVNITGNTVLSCSQPSVTLSAGSYHKYSWSNGATTSQITVTTPGSYMVTVQDTVIGCSSMDTIQITFTNNLQATIQGNTPLTCDHHSLTLSIGSFAHYNWSTGDTTSQITVSAPGTYSLYVQGATSGCNDRDTVIVVMSTSIATAEICGVSVDSTSGENLIVWNKYGSKLSKTFFRLEKEIGVNQFTVLANIPYDSLSSFLDTTTDPQVNSARYRLKVVDSCGNVSSPSVVHETVHLSKNVGINGEVNLIWNAYAGTSYTQLNVQRSVNGGPWSTLAVVSGNVVSYSDLVPPSGTLDYRIEVLIDSTCSPSRSLSGLYSNRVSLVTTGIYQVALEEVVLMPNPVSALVNIVLPTRLNQGKLLICDFSGRTIREMSVNSIQITEDLSELTSGVYWLRHSSGLMKPKSFLKQ